MLFTEVLALNGGGKEVAADTRSNDGGKVDAAAAAEKPRLVWADEESEDETWRSSVKLTRRQKQRMMQRARKRVI